MVVDDDDALKWELTMIGMDPHPSVVPRIVELLVSLSFSSCQRGRQIAASHRLLPMASLVLMQNDTDANVRAVVKARLEYEE